MSRGVHGYCGSGHHTKCPQSWGPHTYPDPTRKGTFYTTPAGDCPCRCHSRVEVGGPKMYAVEKIVEMNGNAPDSCEHGRVGPCTICEQDFKDRMSERGLDDLAADLPEPRCTCNEPDVYDGYAECAVHPQNEVPC